MGVIKVVLLLIAAALFIFGLLMGLGGLLLFLDPSGKYTLVELLVMLAFLSLLPMAGGVFLGLHTWKKAKGHRWEKDERTILQLAAERGGKLSAAEIAAHTRLDSRHARQLLDDMHQRGMVEMQVSNAGAIVYNFPGFLSASEKRDARGFGDD